MAMGCPARRPVETLKTYGAVQLTQICQIDGCVCIIVQEKPCELVNDRFGRQAMNE